VIYTRNGNDVTKRFRDVADAMLLLSATSAIIDAELVAYDALMGGANHGCCDLLLRPPGGFVGHDIRLTTACVDYNDRRRF
jgi:hypothetical protein